MSRRKTLTDSMVASLAKRSAPYPDPELPGHYVRVREGGARTFVAVARAPSGKQIWHTIGATALYSVKDAREKAREAIKAIKEGRDRSGPETFETVANNWYARHVEGNGIISAPDIRSCLDRHLMPAWRERGFETVRRGDVAQLLDDVQDANGPTAADYALAVVRQLCNWYATRHEDYNSPIVKGMRRTNPKERARDRILNDDEIRKVWKVAEGNGAFGAFIRLAILTGQRREKVLGMRWADVKDGEWHIPRTKREKGTPPSLVLPKEAIAIIEAQPKLASNPYVLAGQHGERPFGALGKRKAFFDAKLEGVDPWTIHDLRRTARSLMSRAGVLPHIAERVLGHAVRGIEATYDRHTYNQEMAHALKMLAGLVENILRDSDKKVRRRRG